MEDYTKNKFDDNSWTVVSSRNKRSLSNHNITDLPPHPALHNPVVKIGYTADSVDPLQYEMERISEPCWFYNNGGCRHKDGSSKSAEECKYLHIYSENVKRPPHLSTKKPCDKFNLEGECNWGDNCKYSHRTLSPEEWQRYYPTESFTLKNNLQLQKKVLDTKVHNIEEHIKVLEFKQDGLIKDVQFIGQGVQKCLRNISILLDRLVPQENFHT